MRARLKDFMELERIASIEGLRDERKCAIFRVKTEILKTMTSDLLE